MQSISVRASSVIICLSLAWVAVLLTRHDQPHQPGPAVQAGAETPAQILAGIPTPRGDSVTEKAIAQATERARKWPNESKAWLDLGDVLGQRVRDTEDQSYCRQVELAYRRALALEPRSLGALTGLAWIYGSRHLFEQSVAWAEKALEIDPDEPTAYGIIGDAELELGDYDQALSHYQRMINLRPDLSSYSRSGYLLWVTGHRSRAIALMQRAIRAGAPSAESTAWCRARLAMMLFDDGALISAWQTLEPALSAAPHNLHVLLAAGRLMAARRDYTVAMNFYRRALAVRPNIEALAAIGDLHALEGNEEEAEKFYQQVEALHAANLSGGLHDHMQIARFYADHDRNLVEALRMAEQSKLTRNVLQADTLAWVYFKHGDQAKAEEAIEWALGRGSLDPATYFHAGMIAAKKGDIANARHYLASALSFNPEFSLRDAPVARQMLDDLGQCASVAQAGLAGNK